MKITIFIGGLSGGGAERVACNLANYLSDSGHEITLLTMSQTDEIYALNGCIRRKPLISNEERKGKLRSNFLRYKRLKKYLTESCIEV